MLVAVKTADSSFYLLQITGNLNLLLKHFNGECKILLRAYTFRQTVMFSSRQQRNKQEIK